LCAAVTNLPPFLLSKLLHVVFAGLLIGNLLISTWWKSCGRGAAWAIVVHNHESAILADFIFTGTAVTGIFVSGVANVELVHLPFHHTLWAVLGAVGLGAFLVLWLLVVVPLQRHQSRLLTAPDPDRRAVLQRYWRAERGVLAIKAVQLALLLASAFLMVTKITA
jgi:uncharacterized membrane protein